VIAMPKKCRKTCRVGAAKEFFRRASSVWSGI
jgi:hypothetical protein